MGRTIWLDLPEMGFAGWAEVAAIWPCPPLPEGPGRLITGQFKHYFGQAYDLHLEGVAEPIGITPTHPVWSMDRQEWVPASELRIGERVLGKNGPLVVQVFVKRPGPEPVYNIGSMATTCTGSASKGCWYIMRRHLLNHVQRLEAKATSGRRSQSRTDVPENALAK